MAIKDFRSFTVLHTHQGSGLA